MGQGCGQEESKSGCFKWAKLIKVTVRLIMPQRKYIVLRFLEAPCETFVAALDFLLCFMQALFFSSPLLSVRSRPLLNTLNYFFFFYSIR